MNRDGKILQKTLHNNIIRMIIHPNQAGFVPGMKEWLNICESMSVIYHMNKLKNTNQIVISIGTKTKLSKIQYVLIKNVNIIDNIW